MNKTIKTKNICEIIENIDNPKEAKKIEDTIKKVIKENKNKSIETEEGLILGFLSCSNGLYFCLCANTIWFG